MTDKYKDMLISGLTQLKSEEFSDVPNEEDINHSFSAKYYKAKNKLLKRLQHPYLTLVNTGTKKAAIITVTLLILISSLMTVDATRNSILNFTYKIFDDHSKVDSSYSDLEAIEKYYSIFVPDGFTVDSYNRNEYTNVITWADENNNIITFSQDLKTSSFVFNSESGQVEETVINALPCLTCKNDDSYLCFWDDDDYRYSLIYPHYLGEDFMLQVVGNLIEDNS